MENKKSESTELRANKLKIDNRLYRLNDTKWRGVI